MGKQPEAYRPTDEQAAYRSAERLASETFRGQDPDNLKYSKCAVKIDENGKPYAAGRSMDSHENWTRIEGK
jgi:hypothetical protein